MEERLQNILSHSVTKLDFWVVVACALLLVPSVGQAKVAPGENILRNGALECDQLDVPPFWNRSHNLVPGENLRGLPSGGPGGKPSVRIVQNGEPILFTLRQLGIKLVPGARYRLSAQVRTRGFSAAPGAGVIVINAGWTKTVRLEGIRPTQDWTLLSCEFAMLPSKNDTQYSVAVFANRFTGELEVADIRLEALDAAALAGSMPLSMRGNALKPRLVPWQPLLCRIPPGDRRVTFRFFGRLPGGTAPADYDVVLTADGATGEVRRPLAKGMNVLPLPDGAESGRMTVRTVRRDGGGTLTDDTYRFRVTASGAAEEKGARRLNNLVTELLRETVEKDEADYAFAVKRDAWVHIAVREVEGARVELDGAASIGAESVRGETFRFVAAGRHTLRVRHAVGGTLLVRRVPETFNYPACCNSPVPENPPYDWDFHERHVFPACTTLNGGKMPDGRQPLYRRRGGRWLANLGTTSIADADDLRKRLSGCAGVNDPSYDGVTCDEQFFGSPAKLAEYAQGLKLFNAAADGGRLVYTWIVGKPVTPGLDEEFAAACLNASEGRGRMIAEVYCRTRATEAEARAYLKDYLVGTAKALRALHPAAAEGTGIILGNFCQMPCISLVHHPEVDFKFYLDMQMNMIANDPAFDGLDCTGFWGSYYADEETYRWSMALLRHYCVEGRRTMLSDRYGFRYLPGRLANGDFRGSLKGWRAEGCVAADSLADLGAKAECRWGGAGGLGDTFAVLAKTNAAAAKLSQRVKGLVPGRPYALQACLFDVDAMRAGKASGAVPLSVTVAPGDGRVRGNLSWRHVDRRPPSQRKKGPKTNVLRTVFTAEGTEATVEISNAAAPEGSRLGVNAVSLAPYFEQPDDQTFRLDFTGRDRATALRVISRRVPITTSVSVCSIAKTTRTDSSAL